MLAALGCAALCACANVVPVRDSAAPLARPMFGYAGHHGRPRAFGGGVCAVDTPHVHTYPPSPRGAFHASPQGAVDDRRLVPFIGAHLWRGHACTLAGWHLHVDASQPEAAGAPPVRR